MWNNKYKEDIPNGYKFIKGIGIIPSDWEVKKIGEIGYINSGGTPSTKNCEYWKGDIPWISSSDILENSINVNNIRNYISEEAIENSSAKRICKGSILIVSRVGVGKVAIAPCEIATSQDFQNLTLFNYNNKFICYWLLKKIKEILSFNQGTSIKGFLKSDLERLLIGLPLKLEQQKIADCLSLWDKAIEKQKILIENKREYKKGLMQKLLTGRIRFPEFKKASTPEKPLSEYNENNIPNGYKFVKGIGIIPSDWEVKKLGEVGFFKKGKNISANDLVEIGVPAMMYGDIYIKYNIFFDSVDYRIDYETSERSTKISKNTLLFTCSGETAKEIGKCVCYVGKNDVFIGGDILAVTLKDNINPLFISYQQNSDKFIKQKAQLGQGHSVVHIYEKNIAVLFCIYPTLVEQQKIADFLSAYDKEIEFEENKLDELEKQKKGLMQKLLTGKIRFSEFRK